MADDKAEVDSGLWRAGEVYGSLLTGGSRLVIEMWVAHLEVAVCLLAIVGNQLESKAET
jgi:hypothetical protein